MSISVEMIQASQCAETGTKIFTMVLEYPRVIHSQLMTHRVFSRNGSSTRAIPIEKSISNIQDNPAKFIWTGKQSGMQGLSLAGDKSLIDQANIVHALAQNNAISTARMLDALGVHKQNAGRYLEAFQNIRICITSTQWKNWDWLRADVEAQPEIDELANKVWQARQNAEILILSEGEWHVPFTDRLRNEHGVLEYFSEEGEKLTLNQAINVSMSCSAQTSYRKNDASLEKAEDMQDKLFSGRKVHASPSEHQATPVGNHVAGNFDWPSGVTHVDRNMDLWSGNFKHWIQNRQLIPRHDKELF